MTTVIIVAAIVVVVVLLAVFVVAAVYFFNVGIVRKQKSAIDGDPDLSGEGISINDGWLEQQQLEEVSISSDEGIKLQGYFIPAKNPTNRVAIVVHGYSGNAKRDMGSLARIYAEDRGSHVLMPDNRSHGRSAGKYIGFGWLDRKDYLQWIQWVIDRIGSDVEIVLHGVSMGGATVLMTAGEQLPQQVKGIIADCSYTSVKDILSYQLKRMYKLPSFPLIQLTSLVAKLRAGYSFAEASALRQLQKSRLPVLFIHGEDDKFVPFEMVHRLYEAASQPKELFTVPGAKHGLAFRTDQVGYRAAMERFLNKI